MQKPNGLEANEYREIIGIVIPNAWDSDGRATAWVISAYNEKVYPIDMANEIGRSMGGLSGAKIKASGFLEKIGDSATRFTVVGYEVIEES
jgi:hypothetical protein